MLNEPSRDPELRALEAELRQMAPSVTAEVRDKLFYASAFSAGRAVALTSLRRWRCATILLCSAMIGMQAATWKMTDAPTRLERENNGSSIAPQIPSADHGDASIAQRRQRQVELYAWQVAPPVEQTLGYQLAALDRSAPEARSMTVGRLTRDFLKP